MVRYFPHIDCARTDKNFDAKAAENGEPSKIVLKQMALEAPLKKKACLLAQIQAASCPYHKEGPQMYVTFLSCKQGIEDVHLNGPEH